MGIVWAPLTIRLPQKGSHCWESLESPLTLREKASKKIRMFKLGREEDKNSAAQNPQKCYELYASEALGPEVPMSKRKMYVRIRTTYSNKVGLFSASYLSLLGGLIIYMKKNITYNYPYIMDEVISSF